jgi:hypothetical protein
VGARPGSGAAHEEELESTWGDVATTYGGDALPPRTGVLGHSPREPAGSELRLAPLGVVARDQRWEKKRSFLEPSHPGHWDLDAAEEEVHRVFTETHQALHAVWAAPCIANSSYSRVVRACVAPLNLEGLGAGSSPKLPALGQVSV